MVVDPTHTPSPARTHPSGPTTLVPSHGKVLHSHRATPFQNYLPSLSLSCRPCLSSLVFFHDHPRAFLSFSTLLTLSFCCFVFFTSSFSSSPYRRAYTLVLSLSLFLALCSFHRDIPRPSRYSAVTTERGKKILGVVVRSSFCYSPLIAASDLSSCLQYFFGSIGKGKLASVFSCESIVDRRFPSRRICSVYETPNEEMTLKGKKKKNTIYEA